jgi:replicative DNA helicase
MAESSQNFDTRIGGAEYLHELPHSAEAEQAVLGGVLMSRDNLAAALEIIKSECFYIAKHKQLFEICIEQFGNGENTDVVTVLDEAVSKKVFENAAAGRDYLVKMRELWGGASSFESYCKIVLEKFQLRLLISAAAQISESAYAQSEDAEKIIEYAESLIFDIRKGREFDGLTKLSEVMVDTISLIEQKAGPDRDKFRAGSTGFSDLDRQISGLNNSDLLIIAARPGMGKTSLALNMAVRFSQNRPDCETVIFSLEMSKEQLATRILSSESYVDNQKLMTGNIDTDGDEWTKLSDGMAKLSGLNIWLDDSAGITVSQMKAKLRRLKNPGCVIIDYLQLMHSGRNIDNRVVELSEITRQLKLMAKELNIPLITLSQLNRGVESRTDKRPMLADLRESGSIEQDADIVMFIYRDGYYNKQAADLAATEVIVAKNRHGETGTISLRWNGQYTLFLGTERRAETDLF